MMINKPSVAKYKYTLHSGRTSAQLSTSGGVEIVSILVTAGGSAAAVRVYDSKIGSTLGTPHDDSFVISANTGESTPYTPSQPVKMENGLYIELEQGADFNATVLITYN